MPLNSKVKNPKSIRQLAKAYTATNHLSGKTGIVCAINFETGTADVRYEGRYKALDQPLGSLTIVEATPKEKLNPCELSYYEVRSGLCKHGSVVGTHGTIACECGRTR